MRKIIIIFTILIFSSCDAFLTRSPFDQISSEEFWHSQEDLELYATGLLQNMIPTVNTITRGSAKADCFAMSVASDLLRADSNVSPDNQTGWSESDWKSLRRVNYMLDNMSRCKGIVNADVYRHYTGVAHFWRAWFYYGMVKRFGAVPWYEKTISTDDTAALTKPRDNREFVMDKILEDLQAAGEMCSSSAEYTRGSVLINKWTALAFMSRVCLYEGTYRKYHSVDPSTLEPWQTGGEKFLKAAAESALKVIESGEYTLAKDYRSLFISASLHTEEVIFGREFSKALGVCHDATWIYFSPTTSTRISLIKQFMDTYLMTDGTPFTDRADYKTLKYTEEFENRDKRMAQTVVGPDYKRVTGGKERPYSPDWNITMTGYQPIKWCIDDDNDGVMNSAKSWNSLPIIRYAEVLLNYAEAKAEMGEMDESVWNMTIAPLRNRAGVKSVIPSSPDKYMREYFLDDAGTLDKWILEIRRERGIELCLEMTLRWDDIMRWGKGLLVDSNVRKWRGIYVGDETCSYPGFSISDTWSSTSIIVKNSGEDKSFSIDNEGYLVYEYARKWLDYKYLRPIPRSAITRNPNLKQNPGWEEM